MKKILKNDRSLYWALLLYEESDNISFSSIDLSKYDYLYIKHDKDKLEDGTLKKVHYHVILKFKNYKWLSSLSEELNIPSNYFEKIRSLDAMLAYLLHYKEEKKYHYNFDELVGSSLLKSKLKKIINSFEKDETDIISSFYAYIMQCDTFIKYSDLVRFALDNEFWGEFRRNFSIIKSLTDERNSDILKMERR